MLEFNDLIKYSQKIINILSERGQKLTLAESCTGGLVSALVTAVSGASDVFDMGVCTYANSAKTKLIGVLEQTLITHGAVSANTAIEMANGALKLAGSNYAISITGIAGPNGGSAEKPVGTVFIACTNGIRTSVLHIIVKPPFNALSENERNYIRLETSRQAFILLDNFIRQN